MASARKILFSSDGIEIIMSVDAQEATASIILEENGQRIVKTLHSKQLIQLQKALSELIYNQALLRSSVNKKLTDSQRESLVTTILKLTEEGESRSDYYIEGAYYQGSESRALSKEREAEVFIGLPQVDIDLFTIERIQNATGDFMEAMGFELETQDEPVFGSFFQKLKYLLNNEVKQETKEIYSKGKTALEAQFIDLPSAEATSKLATSAAELITALQGVSDAAIRCGSILLVKVTKDGMPKIITETVSPELAALLNKNPALLQNPSIVFDLISGMRAPDKTIEESGSAELAE